MDSFLIYINSNGVNYFKTHSFRLLQGSYADTVSCSHHLLARHHLIWLESWLCLCHLTTFSEKYHAMLQGQTVQVVCSLSFVRKILVMDLYMTLYHTNHQICESLDCTCTVYGRSVLSKCAGKFAPHPLNPNTVTSGSIKQDHTG